MRKPVICLLASKYTSAGVLYGLYDVLGNVGPDYEEMLGGALSDSMLDVRIVGQSQAPFTCLSGIEVQPHAGIDDIERADAVVICDMYTPLNDSPLGKFDPEIRWIRQMYARDALLCSICSGAVVLAETGLLNGHEASTHWAYGAMLRDYFPQVRFAGDSVLNLSAEKQRLITCGGVTAWQDLAIYLVERFCGVNQASNTAKVYLLTQHEDGQLPFSAMACNTQHKDAVIRDCQMWIKDHYNRANPVSEMVELSGLNARTFARRFRAATGYQPLEYVQGFRIEVAKQLLESDSDNVEVISSRVGYDDPTSFRRVFKRKVGLTPALYRRKFSSIAGRV